MRTGVVIWPDPATSEALNLLRSRYDAMYKLISAHITDAFPSEPQVSVEELKTKVANAAAKTRPFDITLDRWVSVDNMLRTHQEATQFFTNLYPNAVNGIFLLVGQGNKELLDLRRELHLAIPQPLHLLTYPPFLTVGQTLPDEQYKAALAELADYHPNFSFKAKTIDLLVEQPDGVWITEATFPLGPAV